MTAERDSKTQKAATKSGKSKITSVISLFPTVCRCSTRVSVRPPCLSRNNGSLPSWPSFFVLVFLKGTVCFAADGSPPADPWPSPATAFAPRHVSSRSSPYLAAAPASRPPIWLNEDRTAVNFRASAQNSLVMCSSKKKHRNKELCSPVRVLECRIQITRPTKVENLLLFSGAKAIMVFSPVFLSGINFLQECEVNPQTAKH